MKIYKYPLGKTPGDYTINATIINLLGVYLDRGGVPCLYAIVEPDLRVAPYNEEEGVVIHVFWTGWDLPQVVPVPYWKHITTLQVDGLMCHYFASGLPPHKEEPNG